MINFKRIGVVVHTYNPKPQEKRHMNLCDFQVSLVYEELAKTAKST